MRLFKKLKRRLSYLTAEEIDLIHQAYLKAHEGHRLQKRSTGEPYITHPVAVACILADMRLDVKTIMAALLHDVIEDTPISRAELAEAFGEEVAGLVDGVSKLTQIEFVNRVHAQAENFRKMLLAISQDIRVILIKLADRLHNMRTLGALAPEKRVRIARETLDIFAPIAKRLGMREISIELEELGFSVMHPSRYVILQEAVRRARGNRKKILTSIERKLLDGLIASPLENFVLSGREKHVYSLYRKMKNKRLSFSEVMDVYAFRILVDEIDDCYRVLGVVHQLYKPVPERIKDYIAMPKANGYQSLHTTLFGPFGLPLEIQIRTQQMNRVAESGIAAHWRYKSSAHDISDTHAQAQQMMESLLDFHQGAQTASEFLEHVKIDLFPDEVYVFTPQGKIMALPYGSTVLDFAYAVHTDLGNACVAMRVDRKVVPLSAVLSNGQTVEVVTATRGRPSPAWLDFVVTSKAKSAIRSFLRNQRRTESVALGWDLMQKALASYGLHWREIPSTAVSHYLSEAGLTHLDDLLVDIGLGNRVAPLVVYRLRDLSSSVLSDSETVAPTPLVIKGTEGMVLQYAVCCGPIPGDPIIGVRTGGDGFMIHHEQCRQLHRLRRHPERILHLRWADSVSGDFITNLYVQAYNERGVLATVTLAITDASGNIEDVTIEEKVAQHIKLAFRMSVRDRSHLACVITELRKLSAVSSISRGI